MGSEVTLVIVKPSLVGQQMLHSSGGILATKDLNSSILGKHVEYKVEP